MRLFDTHCHLDLYADYRNVLAEIERAGIYTIAMTNTPSVFRHCAALTRSTRFVRTALGLHPELAATREGELRFLTELLPMTRYIGEVGLDWQVTDAEERAAQRRVFSTILERCASAGDKVLSVHSRRAATEVVAMIGPAYPGTVILHWFAGSQTLLDRALSQGCYFSVNTAMLASVTGRQMIAALSPERVLTETDGPFVLTHKRPARPADVAAVAQYLAQHWHIDRARAAEQLYDNFKCALTRTQPEGKMMLNC